MSSFDIFLIIVVIAVLISLSLSYFSKLFNRPCDNSAVEEIPIERV
nr:p5 protein [Cucurbit yellow stunting disorder virus]